MEQPTTAAKALEQLYYDYHQPIVHYLERLVRNHETAEDLAQETFIKALRYWHQHGAGSTRGWLYRIATNTAYDYLRRQRRIRMTSLSDEHAMMLVTPAPEIRLEQAEPIQAALQHIPKHYWHALLLASAGYDHMDIAIALNSNVNTIKTRVHRARTRFRQVYTL
jgi:RNA polymerase sigma-70 factor, ECF subfamily